MFLEFNLVKTVRFRYIMLNYWLGVNHDNNRNDDLMQTCSKSSRFGLKPVSHRKWNESAHVSIVKHQRNTMLQTYSHNVVLSLRVIQETVDFMIYIGLNIFFNKNVEICIIDYV